MALNPFFLQGSPGEQRLIQDLINEQLKIYGVDVIYIPRKFVRKQTIIKEIQSSKFDDNYSIEAYVNNFDGYTGQGDILTKFGMNLKDEISLIISKERFEDFISPFMNVENEDEIEISNRPREGDIIYFPLGQRIFEIKFVEHEVNFYQLGKLYVYELKCELFEYEDEMGGWNNINTTVEEIDSNLEDVGYITSFKLVGIGQTAIGTASTSTGYIRKVVLTNDGYNYTSTPVVSISTAPTGGTNATAVAITTYVSGIYSVKEILLSNVGSGYTEPPTVTITGGNGVGAAATCILVKNYAGVSTVAIQTGGSAYINSPTISFSPIPASGPQISAVAKTVVNTNGSVSQILFSDAGVGYTSNPTVTFSPPPIISGIGTFIFNEIIYNSANSPAPGSARVKSFDQNNLILKVGLIDGTFTPGDFIYGDESYSSYAIKSIESSKFEDKYEDNDQIETEADLILDFSESNPFGNY
jgi:hypothetical protein